METRPLLVQEYLDARLAARMRAEQDFFLNAEIRRHILHECNQYVLDCLHEIGKVDAQAVSNGVYIANLQISYLRTHYLTQDLIIYSELIDAATGIRKQFELICRLHELLENNTDGHLVKQTPNIRHLEVDSRRLYSPYSEVVHSSDPVHLQLLGLIETDEGNYTAILPKFHKNTLVTFQHYFMAFKEYGNWTKRYFALYRPTALQLTSTRFDHVGRLYTQVFGRP